MNGRIGFALAVVLLQTGPVAAQLNATTVGTGFANPVFAASAPGQPGTLFVVQQGGMIRSLNTSTGTIGSTPLLNVSTVSGSNFLSGGERGLLGLAFHPNFQSNGLMYVQYTYTNGSANHGLRVEQYTVSGGVADPASRRTVLEYSHPNNANHNAGWLGFNPLNGTTGGSSGQLYIATGDGGGANDTDNNAQNRNILLGKMLRVDIGNGLSGANPNYAIPSGNMTGANTRPELFSYGLRNPYRNSFDRQTGRLYIADVGQGAREEVNVINNPATGGQNFGWRLREGTIATPGVGGSPPADNVEPVSEYDHNVGQSITGGYVYRGTHTDDAGNPLDGTYFFGDFVQGRVFTLRFDGTTATPITDRTAELGFAGSAGGISSFAEDGFGNLYMITLGGTVFQIVPVPEPGLLGLPVVAVLWLVHRRNRNACSAHPAA